jgi:class 3 adenylate cyclase
MKFFKFNLRFALSTSTLFILVLVSMVYFFLLIFAIEDIAKNSLKRSLNTSVNICSSILDPNDIEKLTEYEQENSPVFINYRKSLKEIKKEVEDIKFVYIVRQTGTNITYIIDCGDDVSEQAKLGEIYDDASDGLKQLFDNPIEGVTFENEYYTDKWGTFLSAYKPIFKDGKILYVVCSDIKSVDVEKYISNYKKKFTCAFFTLLIIIFPIICWITNMIRRPLNKLRDEILKLKDLDVDEHIDFKSSISEVNDMIDATDKVKTGLRSFSKYVPDKVVKQLISQGKDAKIGGEKEHVTILFSDIEGFTSISENNDTQEVVTALNEYFDIYVHCLEENGATVDKFIGDAVMTFWNAPNKVDNHEFVAVKTAMEIVKEIDVLNQKWKSEGKKFIFKTRIGINSGEVIVGNIGSTNRINYTVTGDPVNLASRLEMANKQYNTKILVGENVYNKTKESIDYNYIDTVKVKGKEVYVKVYQPVKLK